ncbi:hypothetical protein HEQ62_08070 [Haematospirillum jordaniae]|uniref:hypothetical protein n=1 Tax=Haematospirillum jordaniae TaxID=1549855 RepID=UPI0012E7620A|nr:hypothetical protein [Haematospirillum jordaniae]NKD45663.1 hypothetical protein [Haematospirillum jordaniae]NKD57780.1 hypothetical protein [Haematospirillum jordaniae]NKD59734.1 hypothetical protein [Haematospirillum jordaniae]NKD67608.1 hypothetical protein [Haematospirillum jordaniae]NKD79645.1 hypothetical protein [Haematospirillum jordaniae]
MKKFLTSLALVLSITGTSHACFYNQSVESVKAHGAGPINFKLFNKDKEYTLIDAANTDGGRAEYKILLLAMATGSKISGATDYHSDCDNHMIKSLTLHSDQ